MNNWQYAQDIPTFPWRSAMSVPRQLTLTEMPGGEIRLAQTPAQQLESLRTRTGILRDVSIRPDVNALPRNLGHSLGRSYELVAEFEPGTAGEFGFEVRKKDDTSTRVGYNAGDQRLFVDRTDSGIVGFSDEFPGRQDGPLRPSRDGRVRMRVLVDRSSVEVFGNEGTTVVTDQIFPLKDATDLVLYARGGIARLVSLEVHSLESVWS